MFCNLIQCTAVLALVNLNMHIITIKQKGEEMVKRNGNLQKTATLL